MSGVGGNEIDKNYFLHSNLMDNKTDYICFSCSELMPNYNQFKPKIFCKFKFVLSWEYDFIFTKGKKRPLLHLSAKFTDETYRENILYLIIVKKKSFSLS